MTRAEFITKVAKEIAGNHVKGSARELLFELAINGECRPVRALSRSYSDSTARVIDALVRMGVPECPRSCRGNYTRAGWYVINDSPKGGSAVQ